MEYFDCKSIKGIEMESEGIEDLKFIGSHFERRMVEEDIMISTANKNAGITMFTALLLEGSGWY